MKELTKKLLKENDSYIEALSKAIEHWNNAINIEDKKMYILTIGEIGNEIHKQNKILNIK